MQIPQLGTITKDQKHGWYESTPVAVPIFDGKRCVFRLVGYENDLKKQDFHEAIANFLALSTASLRTADPYLKFYYQDIPQPFWRWFRFPPSAKKLWQQVQFGDRVYVERRRNADRAVCVHIDCECGWEEEHGLHLVFKQGSRLTRLGPYDGHLNCADASANPELEDVVYQRWKDI
jgi:hypothetical protein